MAKNDCACYALPDSKTYQGPARKKKLIGFTIDWSCDYHCKKTMNDPDPSNVTKVRAYYHDYFIGEEGDEGICEGMVYRPVFNAGLNRYVYNPTEEIQGIIPRYSKSPQLQQWGKENSCD
jgi:hypothetical protein